MRSGKKPFYMRGKFWKWFIIVTIALNVFGAIYNVTPAGKAAIAEQEAEVVAKEQAAAERKAEREAKAEERAAVKAEKAEAKAVADSKRDAELEQTIAAYEKEEAEKTEKAEVMAEMRDENIPAGLQEIVDGSNGVVVKIVKQPGRDDWGVLYVYVSDDWYATPEHEKERFVEAVGNAAKSKVVGEDHVLVNFYDTYEKVLATEKAFGGWKIKR
ncbi:hypothetical protein [Sporosarcina phage Lietuvens]|nr:hypothetical protein [Sporosarcina phage Lietuvens]